MMSNFGYCYQCDRQVALRGNPVSCTLCHGNFIEAFDINEPTLNIISNLTSTPSQIIATSSRVSLPSPSVCLALPMPVPRIPENTMTASSPSQASANSAIPLSTNANPSIKLPTKNVLKNIINNVDKVQGDRYNKLAKKMKHKTDDDADIEPKTKMIRKETGIDEDITCPICYDEWTNVGSHRLVSLKCGHLFGDSCIRRWLATTSKCSQCNQHNKATDIRIIFAKSLKASDTRELEIERKLRLDIEQKYKNLHQQMHQKNMFNFQDASFFNMPAQSQPMTSSNLTVISQYQAPTSTQASVQNLDLIPYNIISHPSLKNPTCFCLKSNGQGMVVVKNNHIFLFDAAFVMRDERHSHFSNNTSMPINCAYTQSNKLIIMDKLRLGASNPYNYKYKLTVYADQSNRLAEENRFDLGLSFSTVVSMEVNQADEIVVLFLNSLRQTIIRHVSLTGQILKNVLLTLENQRATCFGIQGNRYFVCTTNRLIGVNEDETIFLNVNLSIPTFMINDSPAGICVNTNGDIYISQIQDFVLKIHVFDSVGEFKKRGVYSIRRQVCSEPRLTSDGKIAVLMRTDNRIYLFNSLN